MQESISSEIKGLPLDVKVVDGVLKSLVLPFSRTRLNSGDVTMEEIVSSLQTGDRHLRFIRLYRERIKEKMNN